MGYVLQDIQRGEELLLHGAVHSMRLPTGLLLGPGLRLHSVLSHLDDWTLCALLEDEFVLSEDVLELMRALSLRPMLGSMRPVSQPHPCTKQKRIIYWSSPHQLLILTLLRSNVTHVDIAMVPKSVVFFHHKDNPTMSNYQTVI
ncbi:Hypothetical predicted protein [Pelobates cultripes]|uniref:Uncharacterized protein n=1 Tax=Pelobates cultripes TaxID=61616 RepID=A0AAD1SVB0_PELCU|nr:Hypothetical predicted protein [Pelobates cultripes]